jgi:hypothetical protein
VMALFAPEREPPEVARVGVKVARLA